MLNKDEKDGKVAPSNGLSSLKDDPKADPKEEGASKVQEAMDPSTHIPCNVLCSLMSSAPAAECPDQMTAHDYDECHSDSKQKEGKTCPKQLQLPMFLSKTYHMISRSDTSIACWSEAGDNFVIKNVDKFAASVLPLYFKHSNFSSFARQLNFYGFRKLRSDPILTSDVDPQTAGHVRFFHEKFQRDAPELLVQIKRATKTDQQSKDEMESLRHEVASLRDTLVASTTEYERRLAELSYDFNRRLSSANAEFDNLAALVHRFLATSSQSGDATAAAAALRSLPGPPTTTAAGQGPDPLHSLSHIATLHQGHAIRQTNNFIYSPPSSAKRPAAEDSSKVTAPPASTRPRLA